MKIENKNILFIGAHPDDIEIFAGGTVNKLQEDNTVIGLIISDGSQGGITDLRVSEAKKALKILGLKEDKVFFPFLKNEKLKDTRLYESEHEVVSEIEKIIKQFNIDIIFTHHPNDYHQDHRVVGTATMAAARNLNNVIFYVPTFPSGRTQIPVRANLFVSLSEENILNKLNSLKEHQSQIVRYGEEGYIESIKQYARGVALKNTGDYQGYQEEFEINRIHLGV